MHDHLSLLGAESVIEDVTGVAVKLITEVRLTTKLVHALSDLVARGVAESREEGDELLREGRLRRLAEDERVEL